MLDQPMSLKRKRVNMLFAFLSLFLFFSCSKEKAKVKLEVLASPHDSFSVPCDKAPHIYSKYFGSYWSKEKGDYYFTFLDPFKKSFRIFNFNQDSGLKLFKKFKIPKETLGRAGIFAYYIKNLDSIYLIPDDPGYKNRNKIFLINGQGELLHSWQITRKLKNGNDKYKLIPISNANLVIYDKIYIKQSQIYSKKYRFPGEYYHFPGYITIQFLEDTLIVENKMGIYPDYVKKGGYIENNLSAVINNQKELLVLFKNRPLFHVYKNGKLIKEIKFGFKEYNKGIPFSEELLKSNPRKCFIESSMFYDLMYDTQRGFYYVVYLKGIPFENSDGTINVFSEKPKYIIIFDKEFNIVKKIYDQNFRKTAARIFPAPGGFFQFRRKRNNKIKFYYYEIDPGKN